MICFYNQVFWGFFYQIFSWPLFKPSYRNVHVASFWKLVGGGGYHKINKLFRGKWGMGAFDIWLYDLDKMNNSLNIWFFLYVYVEMRKTSVDAPTQRPPPFKFLLCARIWWHTCFSVWWLWWLVRSPESDHYFVT